MSKALCFGALGLIGGISVAFFNVGMGIIVTISILGAGIIYSNETKK